MRKVLSNFCATIEYQFKNPKLLEEAITHPGSKNKVNYQRLEFLGDKVLALTIADFLMKKYPSETEGDLSRRQAHLVSGECLAQVAAKIGMDKILQVKDTNSDRGTKRDLENTFEAVAGAIYLDSSLEQARNFILRCFKETIETVIAPPHDPISKLQEFVQANFKKLPQYLIKRNGGSDHSPTYTASVFIPNLKLSFEASGLSKKEAQKEVAKLALETIIVPKN